MPGLRPLGTPPAWDTAAHGASRAFLPRPAGRGSAMKNPSRSDRGVDRVTRIEPNERWKIAQFGLAPGNIYALLSL